MINLYERGQLIGTIQQFEFHQGHKEVVSVPFGGVHFIQGRRQCG